MYIFTHRGLNSDADHFPPESSKEAFSLYLADGYGLEFDIAPTSDKKLVVLHDATLARITSGKDTRTIAQISSDELATIFKAHTSGTLCTLETLFGMIQKSQTKMHALHVKGLYQKDNRVSDLLIQRLKILDRQVLQKLSVFDLKPLTAAYLRRAFPTLYTFASVAHPFDRMRFDNLVHNTLFELSDIIREANLYTGVWLDEWDLSNEQGTSKILYTKAVFDEARKHNLQIYLVTPELHAQSPGLYGSESHPDGRTKAAMLKRTQSILELHPDGICTDYPVSIKSLALQLSIDI